MIYVGLTTVFTFTLIDLSAIPYDSLGCKFFYAIWICAIYLLFPGCYSTFAPATKEIFGPEYFVSNYGLFFTQNVSSNAAIYL